MEIMKHKISNYRRMSFASISILLMTFCCLFSCSGDPVEMTSIKLSKTTIEADSVGQKDTLTATITPTDAANKNVVWSHLHDDVLELKSDGYKAYIKILKLGTDTIFVSAAEGNGVKSVCAVSMKDDDDDDDDDDE